MDETWRGHLSSFIFCLSLAGSLGRAVTLEYLSPEKRKEMDKSFAKAQWTQKDFELLKKNRTWNCNLFGVRSGLQVERNIHLYSWSQNGEVWQNNGAHLISSYSVKDNVLIGTKDSFSDEIRMSKQGLLISRLTHNKGGAIVIAYSFCNPDR